MTSNNAIAKVSVIVAVKHPAPYLSDAITSITSQTLKPLEILVIESGEREDSGELDKSIPINFIKQTGKGLAQAWNQGIEAAAGTHVSWLDSDDIWLPHALERHAMTLSASEYQGVSVGRVKFWTESRTSVTGFNSNLLEESHLAYMPGCSVVEKSLVTEVGSFREDLGVATDIEWFARLRTIKIAVELSDVVLHKRVHKTNLSYGAINTNYNQDLLNALHAHLQRGANN